MNSCISPRARKERPATLIESPALAARVPLPAPFTHPWPASGQTAVGNVLQSLKEIRTSAPYAVVV